MKFEIIRLSSFSGLKATVYTIKIVGEPNTLFEQFILENQNEHLPELKDISKTLQAIGRYTGAQPNFFKINEGKLGDGVEALYDNPQRKLRLYCIRYGKCTLIVGGGGPKPKNIRTLQESPKLTETNYLLRTISETVTNAIKNRDLYWVGDELVGTMILNTKDNE